LSADTPPAATRHIPDDAPRYYDRARGAILALMDEEPVVIAYDEYEWDTEATQPSERCGRCSPLVACVRCREIVEACENVGAFEKVDKEVLSA